MYYVLDQFIVFSDSTDLEVFWVVVLRLKGGKGENFFVKMLVVEGKLCLWFIWGDLGDKNLLVEERVVKCKVGRDVIDNFFYDWIKKWCKIKLM